MSSLLPVMALAPQEDEKVVDLCAAPGGKTTYIAALMRNTGSTASRPSDDATLTLCLLTFPGIVFANDPKKERCTAIVGNLHRLGVTNAVVSCMDGRHFPAASFNNYEALA